MSIIDSLVADPTSFIHYLPHDLILHYIKPYVQPNIRYMVLCSDSTGNIINNICMMFSHTKEKHAQDLIDLSSIYGRSISHTFGTLGTYRLHFGVTFTFCTDNIIGIMLVCLQSDDRICKEYKIEFYATIADLYTKLVASWQTEDINRLINHKQTVKHYKNHYDYIYKVHVLSPTTYWLY